MLYELQAIKVGPYLAFLWLRLCFSLEKGRLLSHVTKKKKKIYLNGVLSIPDSLEYVYPRICLSISFNPIVFVHFFFTKNVLKSLEN